MRNRVVLIAVGAGVAVLVVWFLFFWGPQGGRLSDARDRRDAAEERADQLEVQIARLRASQDRALQLTAQLEQLRVAVPEQPNLAQFLLDANDAAERSGIDFISVSPSQPSAGEAGEPAAVNLSINISGGYFQVLDFINRLEALPRLVVVDTLTLTPEGADTGTVRLSASISGRMFTTAAAAGPPGTPGATTTTTTIAPPAGGDTGVETTTTTAAAGAEGEGP